MSEMSCCDINNLTSEVTTQQRTPDYSKCFTQYLNKETVMPQRMPVTPQTPG